MNILITGAKGFIGKNLVSMLKNYEEHNILQYDVDCTQSLLDEYTKECDFVIHLAGVNRPKYEIEFTQGNVDFTEKLLENLKKNSNKPPVLMSSSIQAVVDNPYGISKKAAEDLLLKYSKKQSAPVYIYRLPNVFGKWCRPNYNSVVATFCYNIAHEKDITVNDPSSVVSLVYIDDVVKGFIDTLNVKAKQNTCYCEIPTIYTSTVGDLANLIYTFKEGRNTMEIADFSDGFVKKLYATYLSYLPDDGFNYPLKVNSDDRGSFTEFIRTSGSGQVSVNISKPGITKGNHWHQTKTEKFLVVKGSGVIRFRQVGSGKVIKYFVNGNNQETVDIPAGYTHNIENTGSEDMITVMWASEQFDLNNPDTIYEEV